MSPDAGLCPVPLLLSDAEGFGFPADVVDPLELGAEDDEFTDVDGAVETGAFGVLPGPLSEPPQPATRPSVVTATTQTTGTSLRFLTGQTLP